MKSKSFLFPESSFITKEQFDNLPRNAAQIASLLPGLV